MFLSIFAECLFSICSFKQVLSVLKIILVLIDHIAGSKCSSHLAFDTAVLTSVYRSLISAVHELVFSHVNLSASPPFMIEIAVADHVNYVRTSVACNKVIKSELKIVSVKITKSCLVYCIAVLDKSPAKESC